MDLNLERGNNLDKNRNRATSSSSVNNNTDGDSQQKEKLKRFIILGTLVSLVVIGWHLYENYFAIPRSTLGFKIEDEILTLSQSLYHDELRFNSYLADKYDVNLQGKTKSKDQDDKAPQPLLRLHDNFFNGEKNSTVHLLKELFDNYILEVHMPEINSDHKKQEEVEFLTVVLQTPIMQRTMNFLASKGKVGNNYESQFSLLKRLWFENYARNKAGVGSSGFEHVFLAELRKGKVLGLHNWIYFALQEQQHHADYQGYIENLPLDKKNHFLVSFRSKFHGKMKPLSGFLIGTSPELEMSLYTMCFLLQKNKPCEVQLGSVSFNIQTYTWNDRGKQYIASAFTAIKDKK